MAETAALEEAVVQACASSRGAEIEPEPAALAADEPIWVQDLALVQPLAELISTAIITALAADEMPAWLAELANEARQQHWGDWC